MKSERERERVKRKSMKRKEVTGIGYISSGGQGHTARVRRWS